MERDHSSAINEHKAVIKQLNKKTDASMEGMKQQHAGAIAKVSSRFILVNLRNRTGTERKRQTFCGKRGNNYVWKNFQIFDIFPAPVTMKKGSEMSEWKKKL